MSRVLGVNFTSCSSGFTQFPGCSHELQAFLRSNPAPAKLLVILDIGFGFQQGNGSAYLVQDHVNLTGTNPLIGPNDPCGERFTKIDDVYLTNRANSLSSVIAAGLKPGVVPNAKEIELIRSIGADCWCYNLVPTVLLAAHAGFKVLGILMPERTKVIPQVLETLLAELNENQ